MPFSSPARLADRARFAALVRILRADAAGITLITDQAVQKLAISVFGGEHLPRARAGKLGGGAAARRTDLA